MPFVILLFFTRKEGISPSAFKDYFENNHIPLICRMAGPDFPQVHTRMYVHRSNEGDCAASVIMGAQEDFPYDAVAQMEFEDGAAFHKFIGNRKDPEVLSILEEDDSKFSDSSKTRAVILGEICVTKRGDHGK
jgi:hypothetical protein